jgi:hypothetical protein
VSFPNLHDQKKAPSVIHSKTSQKRDARAPPDPVEDPIEVRLAFVRLPMVAFLNSAFVPLPHGE